MITLVRCLEYSIESLEKPALRDEFRVAASPAEVLNQTLFTHRLGFYLGVQPWPMTIPEQIGYLDISEITGTRTDGTIANLQGLESFSTARRTQRLDAIKIKDLAKSIMEGLSPDNIFGLFISRGEPLSSRVYSEVLTALGSPLSEEQIKQMFLLQYQGLENLNHEQELKTARDWSILGPQVVGAEVF
jgi:hypothetical protein